MNATNTKMTITKTAGHAGFFAVSMLDEDGRRHLAGITFDISQVCNPNGLHSVLVYTRRKGDVAAVAAAAIEAHRERWGALLAESTIRKGYDEPERFQRIDWVQWFGDLIKP